MTCSRHKKRRPAMKKISTVQAFKSEIFKEQMLTIGLDLGDRWSFYCVRDEAGKIILEQKLPTPPGIPGTFGSSRRQFTWSFLYLLRKYFARPDVSTANGLPDPVTYRRTTW